MTVPLSLLTVADNEVAAASRVSPSLALAASPGSPDCAVALPSACVSAAAAVVVPRVVSVEVGGPPGYCAFAPGADGPPWFADSERAVVPGSAVTPIAWELGLLSSRPLTVAAPASVSSSPPPASRLPLLVTAAPLAVRP